MSKNSRTCENLSNFDKKEQNYRNLFLLPGWPRLKTIKIHLKFDFEAFFECFRLRSDPNRYLTHIRRLHGGGVQKAAAEGEEDRGREQSEID